MIWFGIAAVLCVFDLAIKHWIEKNKAVNCFDEILSGKIILTKFYNEGAFLGAMRKNAKTLLAITFLCIGVLAGLLMSLTGKKGNLLLKTGLSLLLGGACSNAYERLVRGKVTDYFRINIGSKRLKRVIFNIGDFFVFGGCIITMIGEMLKK